MVHTLKNEADLFSSRDVPFSNARELPDIFTTYRKQVEPLRDAPRRTLPAPSKLPPLPPSIPPQLAPFTIPGTLADLVSALHKPLDPSLGLKKIPAMPPAATSAHPFHGGESAGHKRIKHLIASGSMTAYKDTRNGTLGADFSTKLSAWLALGCVTARQIHTYLLAFEDGTTDLGKGVQGYGKGENKGTAAVRFELLWRDYFRLTTRKFGPGLFRISGFKADNSYPWKYATAKDPETQKVVQRFLEGRTGNGFIDASMRELYLTGTCFRSLFFLSSAPFDCQERSARESCLVPQRLLDNGNADSETANRLHLQSSPAKRRQLSRQTPRHRLAHRRRMVRMPADRLRPQQQLGQLAVQRWRRQRSSRSQSVQSGQAGVRL